MTDYPRISLEQWRSLLAVVDAGGYAQPRRSRGRLSGAEKALARCDWLKSSASKWLSNVGGRRMKRAAQLSAPR